MTITTDKHNQGWAEYTNNLEKQRNVLLKACKQARKDYRRIINGEGMPSIMTLNKLEAAIAMVEDKMSEFKVGDRVEIFNDPITEKDPEGMAILLQEKRSDVMNGLALWLVHFEDSPEDVYRRWIKIKEG